jgi:hypothetical protein
MLVRPSTFATRPPDHRIDRLGPGGQQGAVALGRLRWRRRQAGRRTRPGDTLGGNTSLTVMTVGPYSEWAASDTMGRWGPYALIRQALKLRPLTTPQPIGRRHAAPASAIVTVLRRASRRSLRGLVREVPDRRAPGPCLMPIAMLEFTRAARPANHARWGPGKTIGWEPQAGDWRRRYDGPSDDPGWVGQLGRRWRSRELARRSALSRVLSDPPRHRGGLRPQGGATAKGTGRPQPSAHEGGDAR